MKRRTKKTTFFTFCLVCVILLTSLNTAATEYLAREDGDVTSGLPVSDRIYTIYTRSNRVFDVQNALSSDNSIVWTYPYNGDECQEWSFIKQGTDYVIQDSHSGKYLTVKDNSSSENAELVISSRPSSGFSSGQLFRVEQIGTSIRYRIFSKCSNYTLAIGYDSSWHLRQLPKSDTSTQIYLTESAPYHGLQEGFIHIQRYNTVYSSSDRMLGCNSSSANLIYSLFSNSAGFEWYVKYRGNGFFTLSIDGYYLSCSGKSVYALVSVEQGFSGDNCLWKIIDNGDYYQFKPKKAVTNNNADAVLGITLDWPILLSSSNFYSKWRIIRSRYYNSYDMSIYAAEDYSHPDSHADIFNYACSAIYIKGGDNQKLAFTSSDAPELDASDITELLDRSRIFVLRAHGSPNSFLLNARNGNGSDMGDAVAYNLQLINKLSDGALSNLDCALFLSCCSAEGVYTDNSSQNFVTAVVNKGADCAIGFDGSVRCGRASEFGRRFFDYLASGNNPTSVLAQEAFEQLLLNIVPDEDEDYQPVFYNGSFYITRE